MRKQSTVVVLAVLWTLGVCLRVSGQETGSAAVAVQAPAYRIQTGDILNVAYRFTPEYNQTATVLPDGTVSLQLLGSVRVVGMSVAEARDAIMVQAATRLKNPELSIDLKDYDKPHFAVVGEIVTPGRYELHGQITALDALTIAGGLKTTAAEKHIYLVHRTGAEYSVATLLDVHQLKHAKSPTTMPMIQNGDVLLATSSSLAKVERVLRIANIGAYYPLP